MATAAEKTATGARDHVPAAARFAAAAVLGVAALLGQLVGFGLGAENPAYQAQLSAGRTAWLCAACLAAALVAPGWRGWLAAWVGALAGALRLADAIVASSATLQSDPFWWYVSVVGWAVYAGLLLAVGQALVLLASRASRRWRLALPLGLIAILAVSSAVLLALPEPPYDGPSPAPTAPA